MIHHEEFISGSYYERLANVTRKIAFQTEDETKRNEMLKRAADYRIEADRMASAKEHKDELMAQEELRNGG